MMDRLRVRFRLVVGIVTAVVCLAQPAHAGVPVIDWANVVQSTITAVEDVGQSAQLVLQYKNMLEQYARMLTDGVVPVIYVWDQLTQTLDSLKQAQELLKNGRGALRGQLKQLLDANYYRGSKCYNSQGAKGGCFEGYKQIAAALSEREVEAQDARDKQLEAQIKSLDERTKKEKRLQQNIAGVKGQLEAIQNTNQLLDAQYAELRDTRALLVMQQRMAAEERRRELAREAAQQALSDKWHSGDGKFQRSKPGRW